MLKENHNNGRGRGSSLSVVEVGARASV